MCRVIDENCQFVFVRGSLHGMRRVRCQVCEWEQWTTARDASCVRTRCRKYAQQVLPAARRPPRENRGPGLGDALAAVLGRCGITERRWLRYVTNGSRVIGGLNATLVSMPTAEQVDDVCPCASRRARLNRWGDRQCDKIFGITPLAMRRTRRGRWWLRLARRLRDRADLSREKGASISS